MKKIIITALFALVAMAEQGQEITGRVIDEQGQPMPFANVVLVNRSDSAFVAGAVTKDDRKFSISTDNKQDGLLKVSSVGYIIRYIDAQQGNVGVSFGDIEKGTGMSRGAIFHYADTKLDLFRQVVEQYVLDRQSIDMKIRVGEDPTLREFIDAYIDGVKRTMKELMTLMGEGVTLAECSRAYLSIIQQIAVLLPELSERQQQSITREQQVWHQVISRAVERGEVRSDIDTELMAQTFIALFYGRAYRDSLITGLDADLLKRQMLQLYAAMPKTG